MEQTLARGQARLPKVKIHETRQARNSTSASSPLLCLQCSPVTRFLILACNTSAGWFSEFVVKHNVDFLMSSMNHIPTEEDHQATFEHGCFAWQPVLVTCPINGTSMNVRMTLFPHPAWWGLDRNGDFLRFGVESTVEDHAEFVGKFASAEYKECTTAEWVPG